MHRLTGADVSTFGLFQCKLHVALKKTKSGGYEYPLGQPKKTICYIIWLVIYYAIRIYHVFRTVVISSG